MIATLLTLIPLVFTPQAATPPPQVSGTAEISAFVAALESCTEAKASTPHPLMTSFTVEHTIAGAKEAGYDYRQTMPGNLTMVCTLSVEGRKALAGELSVYAKGGTISGSTSGLRPAWWSECELETADGTRQPMAGPAVRRSIAMPRRAARRSTCWR